MKFKPIKSYIILSIFAVLLSVILMSIFHEKLFEEKNVDIIILFVMYYVLLIIVIAILFPTLFVGISDNNCEIQVNMPWDHWNSNLERIIKIGNVRQVIKFQVYNKLYTQKRHILLFAFIDGTEKHLQVGDFSNAQINKLLKKIHEINSKIDMYS